MSVFGEEIPLLPSLVSFSAMVAVLLRPSVMSLKRNRLL